MSDPNPKEVLRDLDRRTQTMIAIATVQADDTGRRWPIRSEAADGDQLPGYSLALLAARRAPSGEAAEPDGHCQTFRLGRPEA